MNYLTNLKEFLLSQIFKRMINMIFQHNFFAAQQNILLNLSDCLLYYKEMFSKIENGGHLTYFQATLA